MSVLLYLFVTTIWMLNTYVDKGQLIRKLYPVTLESSGSDKVPEIILKLAEVRALNITKSNLVDESHWEKLCKVLRVSNDNSGTKPAAITGHISKFIQLLKLYACLRMVNWAQQKLSHTQSIQVIVCLSSNLQGIYLLLIVER